jgi:hypothetical protein
MTEAQRQAVRKQKRLVHAIGSPKLHKDRKLKALARKRNLDRLPQLVPILLNLALDHYTQKKVEPLSEVPDFLSREEEEQKGAEEEEGSTVPPPSGSIGSIEQSEGSIPLVPLTGEQNSESYPLYALDPY